MKKAIVTIIITVVTSVGAVWAQDPYTGQRLSETTNYISTGIPILLIAPDAIGGAMGDAGVASTPDAYSTHWNNAKLAFLDDRMGFSTTYTPWLRNLGTYDMNLLYLSGYYRTAKRGTVAASLTYFSLGEISNTDNEGKELGIFQPNEFAFDLTYAMKLNDNLSIGATGRFIMSDLTNGMYVDGQSTKAATAGAGDVGLYYHNEIDNHQSYALGLHISNLGSKLNYSDDDTQREFLPANLRIGGRYTYEPDEYNKISLLLDINKLLVPTPPKTKDDSTYSDFYRDMTAYRNTGTMLGVMQSFYDAPGGMAEELHELQLSLGAEYWYANTFAARAGYFFEHATKGGRQYLTFGGGIRYNIFTFDLAYLVPTTRFSQNPLTNTVRISLTMNFGGNKNRKS
ncbi:MAG: type IX secretion system outer membrane channel protein PorV [Bacteroidales bacterium]|nr:type IX secretion system outer membrane channel protein PorV [Bacteroidales bacterium]